MRLWVDLGHGDPRHRCLEGQFHNGEVMRVAIARDGHQSGDAERRAHVSLGRDGRARILHARQPSLLIIY